MTRPQPICIVPARGTEPGLPKRNFKRVAGKPLVAHTIETALECAAFEDVYVSTESEQLAELAREHGATVPFLRPDRLAEADALLHEVVASAVDRLDEAGVVDAPPDTPVVVLQPNVPFRRPRHVSAALETFEDGHDAVISVVEDRHFYWRGDGDSLEPRFGERAVTDELEPFYRETGSINVTTPSLLERGTRVGNAPGYVVTDRLSSFPVESVLDLWLAERIADGPRVVFRVDGGDEVGMGHVSRCLTLAAELESALRCEVRFVSDPAYPSGIEAVRDAGYEMRAVESPEFEAIAALEPDVVFLDVLETDPGVVRGLHETAAAVITLEDSGSGLVHADFAVNALRESDGDNGHNHLAGADYFVLREEFRDHEPDPPGSVENVLFSFGGSDPAGLSVRVCRAVAGDTDRQYRLVVGPDFDAWTDLEDALEACPALEVFEAVDDMSTHMAWADLGVASGGRTAYELAATGTPALVVAQNDREHERVRELGERGVIEYLGHQKSVSAETIRTEVDGLADDERRLRELSRRGRTFVDGAGTRRILNLFHDVLLGR